MLPNVKATDRATCIHGKPLLNALIVEAMSACPNASGTCHRVLADGTVGVGNVHMTLGCIDDLCLRWNHRNGIKKVPTEIPIQSNGNVEYHVGDAIRLCHVLAQKTKHGIGIPKMGGNNVPPGCHVKKTSGSIKGSLQLNDFVQHVQDIKVVCV